MYRQLAELMLTCDSLTKDVKNLKREHKQDIINLKTEHKQNILILKEEHKIEIERLNAKIDDLEQKNNILKNDNERINLKIEQIANEYRFYEDADGKITIPKEFNAPVTYGATLKTRAVYLYSEGAMSIARIQDFINSIGEGISISSGCVYSILTQFHKKITPYLE